MPDPVDVEKDLFGHLAAAHLRTGNMIRLRSRTDHRDLVLLSTEDNVEYRVKEIDTENECDLVNTPFGSARDAVSRLFDVNRQWRVPLGDVEFTDREGGIAVTWRHLKANMRTLKWILEDDGSVFSEILGGAKKA